MKSFSFCMFENQFWIVYNSKLFFAQKKTLRAFFFLSFIVILAENMTLGTGLKKWPEDFFSTQRAKKIFPQGINWGVKILHGQAATKIRSFFQPLFYPLLCSTVASKIVTYYYLFCSSLTSRIFCCKACMTLKDFCLKIGILFFCILISCGRWRFFKVLYCSSIVEIYIFFLIWNMKHKGFNFFVDFNL